MLVRCQECSQVIEVSALVEHLLMECEKHEKYIQCQVCSEAVKTEILEQHVIQCTGNLEILIC